MGNRTEQIDRLAVRLKELESEIRELGILADKAVLEVKAEYRQQIDDLFLKKADVQDKVSKVQEAGGDAWEDMKAGAELSWEVFNDAVKKQSEL
jgi:hypothetical protein